MTQDRAPEVITGHPPEHRNPYRAILTTPGALKFSASGVVARLPMSMVGLGTILMIQIIYNEYSLAGRVAAAMNIAQAIASPQIARLVDRFGQRRVLLPAIVLSSAGLAGLIACAVGHAPQWTLYACAVVTGGSQGSFGAMVRARWTHVLPDARRLHTAYSLESALDELVFVVGPVVATVLATSWFPAAGLLVPIVAALGGGLWFCAQRDTEPPVLAAGAGRARQRSAMASVGMVVLALSFIGMGSIFGAIDVSIVAFATEHGHKNLSGAILAVFATGSGISSLLYGARHWVMAPQSTSQVSASVGQ